MTSRYVPVASLDDPSLNSSITAQPSPSSGTEILLEVSPRKPYRTPHFLKLSSPSGPVPGHFTQG